VWRGGSQARQKLCNGATTIAAPPQTQRASKRHSCNIMPDLVLQQQEQQKHGQYERNIHQYIAWNNEKHATEQSVIYSWQQIHNSMQRQRKQHELGT
jgi:hypothetical protein